MKARVYITLKNGVLDPQGKAIGHALNNLGFCYQNGMGVAKDLAKARSHLHEKGRFTGPLNSFETANAFAEAMNDYWRKTMRLGVHKLQDRAGVVRYGRQDRVRP